MNVDGPTVVSTPITRRVSLVLLLTRISIFIAMFIWVIDKFARPEHVAAVFESFYGISGVGALASYALGAVQLLIMLGFLIGFQKRITYGLVLLMHTASTLISFPKYLAPFESANILFYAAWPMLAACFALYYLRDLDTRAAVE
ncbi:hypothetical protein IQ256_02105 [cf. Phormidesmis sp. LEGE 11477]|nr:hypothetical protein [cf. Phormidesmis sp. LEGE 11477]